MTPPTLMQVAAVGFVAVVAIYLLFLPAVAFWRARLPFPLALFLALSECVVLVMAGGVVTLVLWRLVEMLLLSRALPLAGLLRPVLRRPLNPITRGARRSKYAEFREPMPWTRGPATF